VESFITAFLNVLSIYSPKYEAQPLKVKETPLGFFADLICQIGEMTLTPAWGNLHTAPRRITQEIRKLSLQFALLLPGSF
jgi:hypothetical protein